MSPGEFVDLLLGRASLKFATLDIDSWEVRVLHNHDIPHRPLISLRATSGRLVAEYRAVCTHNRGAANRITETMVREVYSKLMADREQPEEAVA